MRSASFTRESMSENVDLQQIQQQQEAPPLEQQQQQNHQAVYRSHFRVAHQSVQVVITCGAEFRERGKELFYRLLAEFADLHPVWLRVQLEVPTDPRQFDVTLGKGGPLLAEANERGQLDEVKLTARLREICKGQVTTFSLV